MDSLIERKIQELKSTNSLHLEVVSNGHDKWLQYIDINEAEILIERKLIDRAVNG